MFQVRVFGKPSPQGSKNAKPIYRKGKGGRREFTGHVAQPESCETLTDWRNKVYLAAVDVVKAAGQAGDSPYPFAGPVRVRMAFTVKKPAAAPKRRRTWPAKQPDLSKLARAVEDSLTDAGVWVDDALVVEYARLAKVYPGEDPEALEVPGVLITVSEVHDVPDPQFDDLMEDTSAS
jgi:crossover junction endodeoxyribonuclease RusA